MGVEPPATDPAGVDFDEPVRPFSAFFMALSARRFCLLAEGAMLDGWVVQVFKVGESGIYGLCQYRSFRGVG